MQLAAHAHAQMNDETGEQLIEFAACDPDNRQHGGTVLLTLTQAAELTAELPEGWILKEIPDTSDGTG